jgi:hypothetical protein
MVTIQMLTRGRRVLSLRQSLSAVLENSIAIGQNGLSIMQERTVSIQAPILLAEKLQRTYENHLPNSHLLGGSNLPCKE